MRRQIIPVNPRYHHEAPQIVVNGDVYITNESVTTKRSTSFMGKIFSLIWHTLAIIGVLVIIYGILSFFPTILDKTISFFFWIADIILEYIRYIVGTMAAMIGKRLFGFLTHDAGMDEVKEHLNTEKDRFKVRPRSKFVFFLHLVS
eukprot:TRINITY_DN647839_c0_g2_i1.p1 TRINITY_DN647839_c0_g2~~TRINITY_DN647839_c0_g2_i1.p1  ORF type:complete len:156 (-),score=7.11 TRINITY_DN647839_c0_g2_i1:511-948(-)